MAMVLLADVKTRLEITTDAAGDAYLQRVIDALEARVQQYCGRLFELLEYTDTWYKPKSVWARDRPVGDIASVTSDGMVLAAGDDGYAVNAATGQFWQTSSGVLREWGGVQKLELVYDAGYAEADLPADLRELFDRVCAESWNKRGSSGDAASAYGRPDIARETTADVGAVDYVVPSSDVMMSADFVAGFPLAVLDPYCRLSSWLPDVTQERIVGSGAVS